MTMSVNRLVELLEISNDEKQLSKYKGIFTYRYGFFYTFGKTAQDVQHDLENLLKNANLVYRIVGRGEHFVPFVGGAPLAKSSHWYVNFIIEE